MATVKTDDTYYKNLAARIRANLVGHENAEGQLLPSEMADGVDTVANFNYQRGFLEAEETAKDLADAVEELLLEIESGRFVEGMPFMDDALAEEHLGGTYNRLYMRRSKKDLDGDGVLDERGDYARKCLTEAPTPPPDPDIYAEDADPALLEAYLAGKYGDDVSLNSVLQRTKHGDGRFPVRTIAEAKALDSANYKEFALTVGGAEEELQKKVDKLTKYVYDGHSYKVVYVVDTDDTQTLLPIEYYANASYIKGIADTIPIRRASDGTIRALTPTTAALDVLANVGYVKDQLAALVGSAPETLNALNELAAALGNDPNFAATVATQLGEKASTAYVDEIAGEMLAGLDSIIAAQNELLGG